MFSLYGTFQDTFTPNATIYLHADCGSHCEEYGHKPGEPNGGGTFALDFCHMSDIMQPSGGKKKDEVCPPEKGWALIQTLGCVWPLYIRAPVSFCSVIPFIFAESLTLLVQLG